MNTDNQTASTIMIVDCDEDNRCLLKSILELKGFFVLQAANGQEAVELAVSKRPDLMLIELKLPIISGFTAIRRIKKYAELCRTPIIATSFSKPTSHRNLALAAGCAAHLEKPIEFEQLDMLLDQLLPGERVLLESLLVH